MSKVRPSADQQELYGVARRVLLDAADAPAGHLDAMILVGAQAVYLRSADAGLSIAVFTADADLGIDLSLLGHDPRIEDAMRTAGFELGLDQPRPQPGTWFSQVIVGGTPQSIPVDLLVPGRFAGTAPRRRSVNIPPHDKMSARKVDGLELVTVDNDPMVVQSIEPEDDRSVRMKVAGPAALLVAKAYKIRDRAADPNPSRAADKDAGDVMRLMRTCDATKVAATFSDLIRHDDPRIADTARTGIALLVDQFGRVRGPGVALAQRSLAGALPPDTIAGLATAFVRQLPQ